MINEVYLDNCSTTKVCDEAIKAINESLRTNWGNPSSLHKKGLHAQEQMENSRKIIANMLNASAQDIYFTPGGTYSNNMAIIGAANALKRLGNRIITTQIEHSSVLEPMRELEKQGFEVIYLKPNKKDYISIDQVNKYVDSNTILISMMLVNNETGAILPVEGLKEILNSKNPKGLIHVDAIQAFGKLPIKVKKLKADLISFSSHKVHGPKGIGALYIAPKTRIKPIIFGGGQANSISPGTESTHLISGFAAAVEAIPNLDSQYDDIKQINDYAIEKLTKLDNIKINSPINSSPFILNFSNCRIKSETMINYLSSNSIFVSGGSACSKGKRSYVLKSIGLSNDEIDSAIRISFSRFTTKSEIDKLILCISEALNKIRQFK